MSTKEKSEVHFISFSQKGDERGRLVIVEGMTDVPFEIKRIFYIYGSTPDVIRGQHANRKSEFLLINVSGSSKVKVSIGKSEKIYVLDTPHTGIYIPHMVWKEMYDFSRDSILLVLSSEHYDADEYIRNFDEYLKEINNSKENNE